MSSFRSSASFGKRQEFVAIAELMKRNYDVYLTLVDDQQIDCILRLERSPYPIYVDIQIKARSKTAKTPGTFAAMEIRKPRPNFYFIFYSEAANQYWIMPSTRRTAWWAREKCNNLTISIACSVKHGS